MVDVQIIIEYIKQEGLFQHFFFFILPLNYIHLNHTHRTKNWQKIKTYQTRIILDCVHKLLLHASRKDISGIFEKPKL